jgi:hypothetical protein
MSIDITRKCKYCKKAIHLENDNYIYNKDQYSHFNCYVEDKLNKKRNKKTKEEIIQNAITLQKSTQAEVNNIINKEKLYRWLQHNYNVVVIPKYFYIKMDSIFNGSYKGLSRGIPSEDLLDMWNRKKNELNKINSFNIKKGKELIGCERIQYDLAILLSKYDSYLKWKEQQKILENDQKKSIEESLNNKINYKLISKTIESNQKAETNINDLLDEVF